jgi:hypothetical protein
MPPSQSTAQKLSTQAAPLPPARALLAEAILALNGAQGRLHQAQSPLSEIDRIRATASSREAVERRAEIGRLRCAHDANLVAWVDGGAKGDSPLPILGC